MKLNRTLNILHLIGMVCLTMAVIVRSETAIWMACCYWMGREIAFSITDLKKP